MNVVPLYLSAASVIVVMVAFARHNRKTGWIKPRPTVRDALNGFYADLGLVHDQPAQPLPAPVAFSPAQTADFSLDLLKLRKALGSGTPVIQGEVPAASAEFAPVRSR
jgi:hypothetical protein